MCVQAEDVDDKKEHDDGMGQATQRDLAMLAPTRHRPGLYLVQKVHGDTTQPRVS